MKPLPESIIDPVIADTLAAVETARAALADSQSRCEHRFVSEAGWTSIQPPRRICNHCRLVERGSSHSGRNLWNKHDHSPATLGNVEGRIVVEVSQDEFWKMEIRI